ncbi:SdiA-regulated domain-containing protein [Sulfurimonas sp. SAG-AH-194-I05]|nr:SdiA-regulated domain-containing protein [Sulfurimonas sp. SAG-AH-194-I05]MDF1875856.1 SdiA-regulated domain-containing protein [Sulfurimonas sp. SAG-AH-194-I05]
MGKDIKYFFSFFFLILLSSLLYAKNIATIPEASGICYLPHVKQLIVVNDEGWVYKIAPNGKILFKKYLGSYDFEGVCFDKKSNKLLVAVENKNSIFILNSKTFQIEKKIPIKKKYKKKTILTKVKKRGIEAITIYKGNIYLSKQDGVVFKINGTSKKKATITKIYKHGYKDIAGLCFYKNELYMLNDKTNALIHYDLKKNKTLQVIQLEKSAQEGLCFDKTHMYIADDNGNILKYKIKSLGLQ